MHQSPLQPAITYHYPLKAWFGDSGYAVVNDLARLPMLLPKLYLNLTSAH